MVSIEEIQAAYYMVAATGVLVAAAFYIINMRETIKNRRATFAHSIQQFFLSEEGQLRYMDSMSMHWIDIDDFLKKYDSSRNPENWSKRAALWAFCESIGHQYRSGVIDLDAIDSITAFGIVVLWLKFKPVIEWDREFTFYSDAYSDFEYLANLLQKRISERDPDFMRKVDVVLSTHQKDQ